MSKINYLANMNEELVNKAINAVEWEKCDMSITLLNKKAVSLQKTIDKDTSTCAEITLAKEKLQAVNAEIATLSDTMASVGSDHTDFVTVVSSASNEHTNNSETAIRNVLRLSACADNSKFFNIAIIDEVDFGKFYDTFKACHEYDADCNNDGIRKNTDTLKDSFSNCSKLLFDESKGALRNMFSLPIATDYTKKVTVRFNKTDLMHLHDCFVRDINIDITKSRKTKEILAIEASYRYAIKKTVKKGKDTPTYDGATFKGLIAKLAFMHLFA